MPNNEEFLKAISKLESNIGLKNGFFSALLKEDDWSFVIKLHAMYEAAVTALIIDKLGQDTLEAFISRLELGDRSRGKLRIAKDLGLLDKEERKFIYSLSEIRNNFVHNVNNTQIDLKKYLNDLDKNKYKHYIDTFSYTYAKNVEIAEYIIESKQFTRENPKIAIWHNSMNVLFVISTISATEKHKRSLQEAIMKIHDLKNVCIQL